MKCLCKIHMSDLHHYSHPFQLIFQSFSAMLPADLQVRPVLRRLKISLSPPYSPFFPFRSSAVSTRERPTSPRPTSMTCSATTMTRVRRSGARPGQTAFCGVAGPSLVWTQEQKAARRRAQNPKSATRGSCCYTIGRTWRHQIIGESEMVSEIEW